MSAAIKNTMEEHRLTLEGREEKDWVFLDNNDLLQTNTMEKKKCALTLTHDNIGQGGNLGFSIYKAIN